MSLRVIVPLIVIALASPGCRSVIERSRRSSLAVRPESLTVDVNALADAAQRDPALQLQRGTDTDLLLRLGASEECTRAPLLLRFAWVSDVQIRQPDVKLYSRGISRTMDRLIPTFERDEAQEALGWAVYLAHVVALNKYAEEQSRSTPHEAPLSFMIHTGDAIDSGTVEELFTFVTIGNALNAPWLNVIGNHDATIFGNYLKSYALSPGADFYPVGRRGFLAMHEPVRMMSGFGPRLLPVAERSHGPSLSGEARPRDGVELVTAPRTYCHGFDVRLPWEAPLRPANDDGEFDCTQAPGHYAFRAPASDGRGVLVVVLDTARQHGWGPGPEFGADQAAWLTRVLQENRDVPALVFAHHRPPGRAEKAIHASRHDRVFYFSGHTHDSGVAPFEARGAPGFVELNAGSLLEYPQYGRLVEVRRLSDDRTCVISRAAWPSYLGEVRGFSWTAEHEAAHRGCVTAADETLGALAGAARCGHLGAMRDLWQAREAASDSRADGAPNEDVVAPEDIGRRAWEDANVVLTLPRRR